jgi:hypothetical protein
MRVVIVSFRTKKARFRHALNFDEFRRAAQYDQESEQ